MHSHDAWTLLLVDRGNVVYDLGRSRHATERGVLTVLPPDVSHDGRGTTETGYRKRVLYLERGTLDERLIGRAVDMPALQDARLFERMDALHAALARRSDPLEAESRLALILGRIRARLSGGSAPVASAAPNVRLAEGLRELLDSRIETGVSLHEAAELLKTSSDRLVRSFVGSFGVAPHSYLTGRRVELARRHLLDGRPAAEAAALAGFYDQSHLTRHFKRLIGVPPATFARARPAS
ncbi:AraC family transcriptional regulator [Naasia lichenicola]|uniref:AraC family transcriptional regulator n=2 Tax=Naasia lichenicola TaxID=2565933 RepID=A0A4S4FK04_9MICO|nr:AraC family transcriptional regulator [Naasia lichenicola]